MTQPAIRCKGISKQYRIGQRERSLSLRDGLASAAQAPFRRIGRIFAGSNERPSNGYATIWALRDVSFEIQRGEVVGIIGRNGAGKSTLLKILSRITEPTLGRVEIRGRVGSLLEVGTGFHGELTGRDNIFLNGAILGMSKAEITRKFDEIVAFSGVEKFIDTPVKHYSSGMYMRLAFAVAAHLDTEILAVDEVLAVGDAEFQKKCLGKMGDVTAKGRTVLFVSHNMLAVQVLCTRAICLDHGQVVADGHPATVISVYLRDTTRSETQVEYGDPGTAPGNQKIRIRRASVHSAGGMPADTITVRTPIEVKIEYWNLVPGACIDVGFNLYNEHGIMVFGTGSVGNPPSPAGLFRCTCLIPGDLLNNGVHRVQLTAFENEGILLFEQMDALMFDVRDSTDLRGAYYDEWPGAVRPILRWSFEPVPAHEAAIHIHAART
jgi:lipopolysaccharide transport system ATP-binding protein